MQGTSVLHLNEGACLAGVSLGTVSVLAVKRGTTLFTDKSWE